MMSREVFGVACRNIVQSLFHPQISLDWSSETIAGWNEIGGIYNFVKLISANADNFSFFPVSMHKVHKDSSLLSLHTNGSQESWWKIGGRHLCLSFAWIKQTFLISSIATSHFRLSQALLCKERQQTPIKPCNIHRQPLNKNEDLALLFSRFH